MRLRLFLLRLLLPAAGFLQLAAQSNILTYHNNVARTGETLEETTLTTNNVNPVTFGKLFQVTLDGKVDAQPLYVGELPIPKQGTHNVLIVATENDTLYALDADSGSNLWKVSLLHAGETASDDRGCNEVTPQIGITSTPVIRFKTGSMDGDIYAVAMSKDRLGNHYQRLYRVDLATGKTLAVVEIAAQVPGSGPYSRGGYSVFDPAKYKERSGLLLLDGVVYLAWASHCDIGPYNGWIMGYDANTLASAGLLGITPNGEEGAIWGAGAGLAADSSGYIYFLDANGTFDTTLTAEGFPINGDFGNSFIKLSVSANQLSVADYFAMYDTNRESDADKDLGSGGAIVLPDLTDVEGTARHLAIGAGKDGNIYVVDRDNLGKFNPANDNAIYQELVGALPNGVFSIPAYYRSLVYFGSVSGPIRAFQFNRARLSARPVSVTSTVFPFPGATASISANGETDGILWAVENSATAVLHAYVAENLTQELYNSDQAANGRDQFGSGNKFMVPTIANGKVYVGTPNGVAAFGLLNSH